MATTKPVDIQYGGNLKFFLHFGGSDGPSCKRMTDSFMEDGISVQSLSDICEPMYGMQRDHSEATLESLLNGHAGNRPESAFQPNDSDATVAAALECGFLHFDTAPSYNNGTSESRLGHGLAAAGSPTVNVWSKCGKLVRGPAP